MPRYAHADVLDNGPKYIKDNCNKVVLTSQYDATYAGCNSTYKVAEATLVTGDFAIAGADGAARTMTATLTGKSGGNALMTVADGTNMHIAFLDTTNSKVLYVTEESSNQAITSGNAVTFFSNPTYAANQPTA
jgi:hypothetical protein